MRVAGMPTAATHFCLVRCCVSLQAAAPFPGSNQSAHADAAGGANVIWRHYWCGVRRSLNPCRVGCHRQSSAMLGGLLLVGMPQPHRLLPPGGHHATCTAVRRHGSHEVLPSMPSPCCCSAAGHVCRGGRRHITGVLWCGHSGTPVAVAAGVLAAGGSYLPAAPRKECAGLTHTPLPLCMQARSLCCGWCAMRSCTGATSQTSRCTSRSECPAACLALSEQLLVRSLARGHDRRAGIWLPAALESSRR